MKRQEIAKEIQMLRHIQHGLKGIIDNIEISINSPETYDTDPSGVLRDLENLVEKHQSKIDTGALMGGN